MIDKRLVSEVPGSMKYVVKNILMQVVGPSGCRKSTFVKLLMCFWKMDSGKFEISGKSVDEINTKDLRNLESFVT